MHQQSHLLVRKIGLMHAMCHACVTRVYVLCTSDNKCVFFFHYVKLSYDFVKVSRNRFLGERERKTGDPSIRKKPGAEYPLEGSEPLVLTRICWSRLKSNLAETPSV